LGPRSPLGNKYESKPSDIECEGNQLVASGKQRLPKGNMQINWRIDSRAAFDLVVYSAASDQGAGLWSFGGFNNVVSPSGLWKVNSGDQVIWDTSQSSWNTINGGGGVMFLGPTNPPPSIPFLLYMTFHAGLVGSAPIYYCANTASNGTWAGKMRLSAIFTDSADPYSWLWMTHYWGSGPAIPQGPAGPHHHHHHH